MRESKLINILKRWENAELKSFDKFVRSPYFNKNKNVIKFWEILWKYAPDFTAVSLDKVKVYKKMFPGKRIDDAKLSKLQSQLFKLMEKFLAIEQIQTDDFLITKKLGEAYYTKELYQEYEKVFRQLIDEFEESRNLNPNILGEKLMLYKHLYFNQAPRDRSIYPLDLKKGTNLLEDYYQEQKLYFASEWFSRATRYNETLPSAIKDLKKQIEHSKQDDPLSSIYYKMSQLFLLDKEKTKDVYFSIKNQITNNYQLYDIKEKNRILKHLLNFAIRQFNTDKDWGKEIFELYKLGLSDNALLHKGKITSISFLNITYQACIYREFNWVDQFMEEYATKLPIENKLITLRIAKGYKAIFLNRYEESLSLLSNISTNVITLELTRRSFQIRSALECYLNEDNYKDILLSLIKSFDKYLGRKEKITSDKKTPYTNFLKAVRQIINWKESKNRNEILIALKEYITTIKPLPNPTKEWLLDILNRKKIKGYPNTGNP